jgi:secretion/DNA translocation related TadE-like protein
VRIERRERTGDDRGSITLVSAAAIALAFVVALGSADLGRVLVARSRARTAADAAALAAAQELALPTGRLPAEVAADYAARNGAALTACACEPATFEAVVQVAVEVDGLLLLPGARTVAARARAIVAVPTPPVISSPTPAPSSG